jgi:hypothetical protein
MGTQMPVESANSTAQAAWRRMVQRLSLILVASLLVWSVVTLLRGLLNQPPRAVMHTVTVSSADATVTGAASQAAGQTGSTATSAVVSSVQGETKPGAGSSPLAPSWSITSVFGALVLAQVEFCHSQSFEPSKQTLTSVPSSPSRGISVTGNQALPRLHDVTNGVTKRSAEHPIRNNNLRRFLARGSAPVVTLEVIFIGTGNLEMIQIWAFFDLSEQKFKHYYLGK